MFDGNGNVSVVEDPSYLAKKLLARDNHEYVNVKYSLHCKVHVLFEKQIINE